jgi:cytochrome c-type biogenesis protein CcmH
MTSPSRAHALARPVRRASALIALALLACAAAAHAAQPARASLPAIEREVMCVTCKIPLQLAQSPQADRERAFIAALIARGADEPTIKRALVSQYGSAVLALPSAHGFNLAAYLVPLGALLVVLAALAVMLPRWRRAGRSREADPATPQAPRPLSDEDAARVAADMARFD